MLTKIITTIDGNIAYEVMYPSKYWSSLGGESSTRTFFFFGCVLGGKKRVPIRNKKLILSQNIMQRSAYFFGVVFVFFFTFSFSAGDDSSLL